MRLDAHVGVTYFRSCHRVGGPLSRRSGNESPERVEASGQDFLGVSRVLIGETTGSRKEHPVREKHSGVWLVPGLVMVYFSLTSTGKPDDGSERRETVGKAGWKDGKPNRRPNRKDGKPNGWFNPKPKGNRRQRAVGRPSGDPSGSSNGMTASRPKGLQTSRKRGERSSDRTAAGSGRRRSPSEVRSPAGRQTG